MKIKLELELDTDNSKDQAFLLKLIDMLEEYKGEEYDNECE
jgi:hypothetical protein